MRTLWNIIAVMALANLLAMGAVAGWLFNSGRLDPQRIEELRAIIAEPVAAQRAREAEAAAQAEAEAATKAEEARLTAAPVTASEVVAVRLEASEIDRQRIERLRREVEDLRRVLAQERRTLDEESAAFVRERDAFTALRAEIAAREGDTQFRKSVEVYQSMKAKDAVSALLELERGGSRTRVVDYLNAMEDRARVRIAEELTKQDPALAAQLLEAVSVRGVEPAGP